MNLEALPADKGDSFILTWGNNNDEHSIIIDCGIPGTYRFLRQKMSNIKSLEGIFITHVDYDHLGGLQNMLKDRSNEINCPVYINTPELILDSDSDPKVSIKHGVSLEESLNENGVTKIGLNAGDEITIEGLTLTVLSPTNEILQSLKTEWTKENIYQDYLEKRKTDGKVSSIRKDLKSYRDIIKEKEIIHKWKDDLINSSSIAFIAEYNGKRILFLGDSNPDVIAESLCRIYKKCSEQSPMKIDLVKVSHHGSKHNTSSRLLKLIDCNSFYISTNGNGPYYHPNRETIVRISEFSRSRMEEPINIYCNYDLDKQNFITEQEETDLNISITTKNEIPL